MVIHFKYSSVYTSIPDLLTIPSLLCPPPITIRSLCKSVSLFLFCKCVHLYHLFRFHTHFSLNLVTDVVMIATDVACTFSVCSKSPLPLLQVLKFSTSKGMCWGKLSYAIGAGSTRHQVPGRVYTLTL